MRLKLLDVLACPKCSGILTCRGHEQGEGGDIVAGELVCGNCLAKYPIIAGIPRFVPQDNYATSFGYQWNSFRVEQIDSHNGTELSKGRFHSETGWTEDWLKSKWVLDAGCGAGRFLDVVSRADCEVVGFDMSNAVDAAKENLVGRQNVHLVQASIYELPFRSGAFEGCYCIGVVQHTPNPQETIKSLPRVLRRGGRIAISAYERKPWTRLYAKYLFRPVTKRLHKEKLLAGIRRLMPVLFPITSVLFRVPFVGRIFMFTIPVANYVHERALTRQQRYQWAILDTFDMLSPQYDQPLTKQEIEQTLANAGIIEIQRLSGPGAIIIGCKGA